MNELQAAEVFLDPASGSKMPHTGVYGAIYDLIILLWISVNSYTERFVIYFAVKIRIPITHYRQQAGLIVYSLCFSDSDCVI